MATTIAASEVKVFIDGQNVGTLANFCLPEKMVTVWLGGTFPDGTKAGEVKLSVPESVAKQGATAVKDWWFESIRKRDEGA